MGMVGSGRWGNGWPVWNSVNCRPKKPLGKPRENATEDTDSLGPHPPNVERRFCVQCGLDFTGHALAVTTASSLHRPSLVLASRAGLQFMRSQGGRGQVPASSGSPPHMPSMQWESTAGLTDVWTGTLVTEWHCDQAHQFTLG